MGITETKSVFNNPVTKKLVSLRQELERTPWYHFMERVYLKDEIMYLERIAFQIGLEIALKDLCDMGILKEVKH